MLMAFANMAARDAFRWTQTAIVAAVLEMRIKLQT